MKFFLIFFLSFFINLYAASFQKFIFAINQQQYISALSMLNKNIYVDYKKRLELLSKENNSMNIQYMLAVMNLGLHNDKIALKILKKLVQYKHSEALNTLASLYFSGRGVSQNKKKSFELYSLSAKNNSIEGQYNLATAYLNGFGTEQDKAKAFQWFQTAAKNGYGAAYAELAIFYLKGDYVKINDMKSLELFKKAIRLGYKEAKCKIAYPLVFLHRYDEAKSYLLEGKKDGFTALCQEIWTQLKL